MIGIIHHLPEAGSNVDLSGVTATASDVLEGKVIVDANGNPLTGTMANIGAVSQSLAINGTYNIPQGYHDGGGKVTQSIATMSGQTLTPKTSAQTVSCSGKYMTGNIVVNAMSSMAGQTITPKSSAQTISCSGKYMTGNVVVNGYDGLKVVTGTTAGRGVSNHTTNQSSGVVSTWTVSLSGFKTIESVAWGSNSKGSYWISGVTLNSNKYYFTGIVEDYSSYYMKKTSSNTDMVYSTTSLVLPVNIDKSAGQSTVTVRYWVFGKAS